MKRTQPYLEEKMRKAKGQCGMQVVFVDIVSYSRRKSFAQVEVIYAFMRSIEEALTHIARQYVEYAQNLDVQIRRDVVVLPSGDGAAVGFPFDDIPDMHLTFACELLRIVSKANREIACDAFKAQGWCNCHSGFLLRCGVSEGKLILYTDLNGNFNLAGDTVNMASRVMNLANAGQIFLTRQAHDQITDLIPDMEPQFRRYRKVKIKHDLTIDIYQYIDEKREGLDASPRDDLVAADEPQKPAAETAPSEVIEVRTETADPPANDERRRPEPEAGKPETFVKALRARMVLITPGEFVTGTEQTGRVTMTISRPFLIDRYPVTQEDYSNVMGRTPSKFAGPHLPVESISWLDAVAFCNRLSEFSGLEPVYSVRGKEGTINFAANGYRLPTEAEWEYCCRGGAQADGYGAIDRVAWYHGNSEGRTHEVGKKEPNGLGLYDMLGNVWEWCNDWYQRRYPEEQQADYTGPESGFERVLRGGSWGDLPDCVRANFRHRKIPLAVESTHGMRVVLPSRE